MEQMEAGYEHTPPATKTCPACAETILAAAKKCKHCSEILDTGEVQHSALQPSPPPEPQVLSKQPEKRRAVQHPSFFEEPLILIDKIPTKAIAVVFVGSCLLLMGASLFNVTASTFQVWLRIASLISGWMLFVRMLTSPVRLGPLNLPAGKLVGLSTYRGRLHIVGEAISLRHGGGWRYAAIEIGNNTLRRISANQYVSSYLWPGEDVVLYVWFGCLIGIRANGKIHIGAGILVRAFMCIFVALLPLCIFLPMIPIIIVAYLCTITLMYAAWVSVRRQHLAVE